MSASIIVDDKTSSGVSTTRARGPVRVWLSLALVLVLIGVAVAGVRWWTSGRFLESTDDAYLKADSVTIAPKVAGYITDVYVSDGQEVSAGQPLVRIDSRLYQALLTQASATGAAREADIARAEADLQLQRAKVLQSQAEVRGARASDAYARDQVLRYEPLVSSGAESDERLAELRNIREQSAATVAADAAALQAAERQLVSIEAQIQQAHAQREAAVANAQQMTLDMQDTIVRSTLAGRVGDRAVRVGQYVQPGARLMTVVPVQDLYLEANFKETQIELMRTGQPATVHVDALPGTDLRGTVLSLSPGTGSQFALLPPENATGNFTKIVQRVPVKIRLDVGPETRKFLMPGLSVRVRIDTRSGVGDNKRVQEENARG